MIFIMTVVKMNVRYGTMVIIILEIIVALFLPISPPWSNVAVNEFAAVPDFLELKFALILIGMFLFIILRAVEAHLKGKKTATWKVGNKGEQEFADK